MWLGQAPKLVLVFLLANCACWESLRAQTAPNANDTYRIAGMVVDGANGKPLGRSEVTLELIEGKNLRQTNATGADGGFSFEGLPAGRYRLSAKRRGYVERKYKGHEDYWSAIVAGPGLKSDDVRFVMTAGASITGHVFDERGDPVRRGNISLLREVSSGGRRRLTRVSWMASNDLGVYRFGHLEPGVYVVAVIAQPWYAQLYGMNATEGSTRQGDFDTDVAYAVTFYPSATDADAAGRITLTAGESVTADMALSPVAAQNVSIKTGSDDPKERGGFLPCSTSRTELRIECQC